MSQTGSNARSGCVVFAGGGSGGHIAPGLAIAECVKRLDDQIDTRFLCSRKAIDAQMLDDAGIEHHPLPAIGLSMRPPLLGPWRFLRGWMQSKRIARSILHELQAKHGRDRVCIVGLGGYIAAPVARAGHAVGMHVLLMNLDVVPGKANRRVARWGDQVISAVPIRGRSPFGKAEVLGMPVRRQAIAPHAQAECRRLLDLKQDRMTLVVTGASQGAGTLNDLLCDLVCESSTREIFDNWQVLHLCGPGDDRANHIRRIYREAKVPAQVVPFLHEMGLAWGAADLTLARAGASTVAEAVLNQVPTVFAPYPWHRDLHQKHNAEPYVKAGGAWLAEDRIDRQQNRESIGAVLLAAMRHPAVLERACRALEQLPRIDAANEIARRIVNRLS